MNSGDSAEWLGTTVAAVRELMLRRLEAESLDAQAKREIERALAELDVMGEALQRQAALLARENARYAEFFEYAPDAYAITDAGCRIREANHALAELLRAQREDLVGQSLSDCVEGAGVRCEFSVRAIALKKGGGNGLCWLIRPVANA